MSTGSELAKKPGQEDVSIQAIYPRQTEHQDFLTTTSATQKKTVRNQTKHHLQTQATNQPVDSVERGHFPRYDNPVFI